MDKTIAHKGKSIFQQILEDKRAIRQCIQSGGDIKKIAQERGIKFATPIWNNKGERMELFLYNEEGVLKIKLGADYADYTDLYFKFILEKV